MRAGCQAEVLCGLAATQAGWGQGRKLAQASKQKRAGDTQKKAERNFITLCFYRLLLSSIAIYYEYHLLLNFNDVLFDITALP